MVDERDLEIARLRGELAGRAARRPGDGAVVGTLKVLGVLLGLGVLLLIVALSWSARRGGDQLADRALAIQRACTEAGVVSEEITACRQSMVARYRGDLDPSRLRNAAAEHVRVYREGAGG